MRRIAVCLFTLGSAASLALCVAACVLWARSYRVSSSMDSHVYWVADGRGHRVEYWGGSCTGGLYYARHHLWSDDPDMVSFWGNSSRRRRWEAAADPKTLTAWHRGFELAPVLGGFAFTRTDVGRVSAATVHGVHWAVAAPYWSLAGLLAMPSAAWLTWFRRARRRTRRLRAGACVACGYDLRASTGRCPECGRPAPPTTTTRGIT